MYRLNGVVLKARDNDEPFFNKIAEDYIEKASQILTDFVNERPENVGGKFFGVGIRDIDFNAGTVELEKTVWRFNTLDDCVLTPEDEMTDNVLYSEYNPTDIEPFIEQLRKKKCEYFFYEDEMYDCIILIPIFKVN